MTGQRPHSTEQIKIRDELLQVLYWLAGEGFQSEATADGIARFMARPPDEVRPVLEDAVRAGLVERQEADGKARYSLTAAGRQEGKRRFAEEFTDFLARDAHGGACTDPNCDCHQSPEASVACRHEHGGHP